MELQPGDVLDDAYEIVRSIGSGGMGEVYEAQHHRLEGLRVAIKILHPDASISPEVTARFRREAEIGAVLHHPNIVRVTDWNKLASGQPYLVMEHLEGATLSSRLLDVGRSHAAILALVKQLGAGLSAAHASGVVHRDLKPSNVFLVGGRTHEDPGWVKILDFGISKVLTDRTLASTESGIVGTPCYMAPEQIRAYEVPVDQRADQFAMAAIIYELYTGVRAFAAPHLDAILYAIVHGEPDPIQSIVDDVPDGVSLAIARALSKDPDDRFDTVGQFAEALLAAHEEPISTEPRAMPSRSSDPTSATVPLTGTGSAGSMPNPPARSAAPQSVGAAVPMAPVIPHTPAPTPNPAPRVPRWAYAGMVVVGIGVGLAAVVLTRDSQTDSPLIATTDVVAALPPDDQASDTTSPVEPAPPPANDALAPGSSDRLEPKSPPTTPAPEPLQQNPRSALARSKLADAEDLHRTGNYQRAIRRVMQSIAHDDSAAGRALLVEIYCGLKDLGNARASMLKLPPAQRARLRKKCELAGIHLP